MYPRQQQYGCAMGQLGAERGMMIFGVGKKLMIADDILRLRYWVSSPPYHVQIVIKRLPSLLVV